LVDSLDFIVTVNKGINLLIAGFSASRHFMSGYLGC
jgi:hypothetical protein